MDHVDSAIACSLASADYRMRLEWIEKLNAEALRDYHREGSRIELTYDPAAAALVHEFVRGEQQCCPFLKFRVHEGEAALIVTIEGPDAASEAVDERFTRGMAT